MILNFFQIDFSFCSIERCRTNSFVCLCVCVCVCWARFLSPSIIIKLPGEELGRLFLWIYIFL